MKKIIENRFIYRAIITIISLYVLVAFVKLSNINGYERAMFSDMVYGTA